MLETKPQPTGRAASPRSTAYRAPSALGATASPRPLPPRAPMPERDPRQAERAARRATDGQSRSRRVNRSEARLLTWTVSSAVVVCGLLVLYLAAYAHLTTLGIAQARAQHEFREKWQQNQMLRAQVAALKNPDRIAAGAVRLGLTKDSRRVDYISPAPPASAGSAGPAAPAVLALGEGVTTTVAMTGVGGEAGPQGTDSGPTSNDNTAARHD